MVDRSRDIPIMIMMDGRPPVNHVDRRNCSFVCGVWRVELSTNYPQSKRR